MIKYFHMFLVYDFWTRAKAIFDFQSLNGIDFRGWYDFSFPIFLGWLCLVSKKCLKKDVMFFLIDRMRNGPFVFTLCISWMLHFGLMVYIRNMRLLCVGFIHVLVNSYGPCGHVFFVYILFVSC